jgi:hypothetical protein
MTRCSARLTTSGPCSPASLRPTDGLLPPPPSRTTCGSDRTRRERGRLRCTSLGSVARLSGRDRMSSDSSGSFQSRKRRQPDRTSALVFPARPSDARGDCLRTSPIDRRSGATRPVRFGFLPECACRRLDDRSGRERWRRHHTYCRSLRCGTGWERIHELERVLANLRAQAEAIDTMRKVGRRA